MADQTDPLAGVEILPADDLAVSPEVDVVAAEASALDAAQNVVSLPPEPMGRTWDFDWERGRFKRDGTAPREVRGTDAVAQWAQMVLHTAQRAHPIFSARFGVPRPDGPIGDAIGVLEGASDWAAAAREALLLHDRIASVENVTIEWYPEDGLIYVRSMDAITDEAELDPVRFGDLAIGTVTS